MKVSNQFKEIIKSYLMHKAETDILFKPVFQKSNKNIDDCITYVLNEVKKTGINAFADEEIFSMCIHYYDEDDIKVDSKVNTKISHSSDYNNGLSDDNDEVVETTINSNLTPEIKSKLILDDDEEKGLFD